MELLDHLYWAGHGASRDRKGRSLRWIGPYYPGPDAGQDRQLRLLMPTTSPTSRSASWMKCSEHLQSSGLFDSADEGTGMDCDRV